MWPDNTVAAVAWSPLEGMKVLDVSAWRPMPHATQILADLGAEVLKVEPPGGDPMRGFPEIFARIARGKRSVVLDLKSDAGRDRALELAAEADVFCEAWRPGVADRLGLGPDAVMALNPTVIYCSLSGYGQTGPWRDRPGHDINFQAVAGALRRGPDEAPEAAPRIPVADLEGGTVCAALVCAAWARRLQTGEGARLDVAMADVVAWWIGPASGAAVAGSERRTGGVGGYGTFATADGGWVALGTLTEQHLWDAVCRAVGLSDLVGLGPSERIADAAGLNGRLAAAVADLDLEVALERFTAEGAPASPVLVAEDAAAHEQLVARRAYDATPGTRPPPGLEVPAAGDHHGFT
jgi:crotonobetainyl-CoA:carnitine CoA-transferase CaiB-like acyl-CoA transferase